MTSNRVAADLHSHSEASYDAHGNLDEYFTAAVERGLGAISLTEHNTVRLLEQALEMEKTYPDVEYIPGLEIGGFLPSGETGHLLIYYADFTAPKFLDWLEEKKVGFQRYNEAVAEELQHRGHDISLDELIEGYCLQYPHLTWKSEERLSNKFLRKYLVDKGAISNEEEWGPLRREIRGKMPPCKTDSFPFLQETLDATGGLRVLAHPGASFRERPDRLREWTEGLGVDGIEAFHWNHDPEMSRYYVNLARENDLVITGGSDCHDVTGRYAEDKFGKFGLLEDLLEEFLRNSERFKSR